MAENNNSDITTLTVQLLSAFVSKNEVSGEGLAELIKTTRAALTEDLAAPAPAPEPEYAPAVSVRKSLSSPDHILSLIDGKPYKTLKRHLAANGLTEQDYRARYNLPASYPMVAQSYSDMRRAVAEKNGLGKKSANAAAAPAEIATARLASDKQPAPKKAPAKAAANKAASEPVAAKATVTPAKVTTTEPKAAAIAAAPRKKLSMFGSKDAKAAPAAQPQVEKAAPAAATATPVAKANAAKAAPKAKGSAKPKSLQSALKAAGAHLGSATDKKKSTDS